MHEFHVFVFGMKFLVWQGGVIIKITIELCHHSKIIDENRVLVDMFKNTEFSFFEGQFEPVAEIFVCIYDASFLVFALYGVSINYLDWD